MFIGFNSVNKNASYIKIIYREDIVKKIRVNKNEKYSLEGTYGAMNVEVEDGEFRITEEECPNHICSELGWVKAESGMPIICLPNEIVVVLDGN